MIREDPFYIFRFPHSICSTLRRFRRLKKAEERLQLSYRTLFFVPNRIFLVYARFGDMIPVEFEFSGYDSLEGCRYNTQEIWTGRVIPPPPLRTLTGISCQTKHLLLFSPEYISISYECRLASVYKFFCAMFR